MFDKNIIKKNFGRHASQYENNARLQKRVAIEVASRSKHMYGQILDIGSGTGMLRKLTNRDLIELDISFDMCQVSGGVAVNADAESLPFKDASFDGVLSSLALQWSADLDKSLAEVLRVLKPKGQFVFSSLTTGTLRELDAAYNYLDGKKHTIEFEPAMRMFARLKKAGFAEVNISAQTITYWYKDIFTLLRDIKSIGASYNFSGESKGLKGKDYFKKLENIYRSQTPKEEKLPAKWEVIYITARK